MRYYIWVSLGWGLTVVVALGMFLRSADLTSTVLIGLAGLTPLLLFPAIGVVLSAWNVRSRYLTAAAIAVGVVYVISFANPSNIIGCGAEPTTANEFTIFNHNVLVRGGSASDVAVMAASSGADIMVLQEVSAAFIAELESQPGLGELSFRVNEPKSDPNGFLIWSRFPLTTVVGGPNLEAPTLHVTVDGPAGPFSLIAVHTTAPVSAPNAADWDRELKQLVTIDNSTPIMLVGDFNATEDHNQFRSLLGAGWTNAHHDKGCGFDRTWPSSAISVLRLDHVLVSSHFRVLSLDVGDDGGSDHRSLIVRLAPKS